MPTEATEIWLPGGALEAIANVILIIQELLTETQAATASLASSEYEKRIMNPPRDPGVNQFTRIPFQLFPAINSYIEKQSINSCFAPHGDPQCPLIPPPFLGGTWVDDAKFESLCKLGKEVIDFFKTNPDLVRRLGSEEMKRRKKDNLLEQATQNLEHFENRRGPPIRGLGVGGYWCDVETHGLPGSWPGFPGTHGSVDGAASTFNATTSQSVGNPSTGYYPQSIPSSGQRQSQANAAPPGFWHGLPGTHGSVDGAASTFNATTSQPVGNPSTGYYPQSIPSSGQRQSQVNAAPPGSWHGLPGTHGSEDGAASTCNATTSQSVGNSSLSYNSHYSISSYDVSGNGETNTDCKEQLVSRR